MKLSIVRIFTESLFEVKNTFFKISSFCGRLAGASPGGWTRRPHFISRIAAALSASGKIGFPIPHCIAHPAQNSTYCSHRMYMKSAFCLPVLSSARFRNCFLQHCFGEVLEAARQHPIRNTGSGQHLSHKGQSKRAGHICVLLLFSLIVSDWSAALPVRRMLPAPPRTPGCGRASSRCWPAHET